VAKALGRDEPGPRALELEDRIGGDGRAVQDLAEIPAREPALLEQHGEPVHDGVRIVVDRRRDLLRQNAALGVEQDDVGERAADVDADAEARLAHRITRGSHSAMSGTSIRITTPSM